MKSGLLTDGIGGKSSTSPCTANRCFFLCRWRGKRAGTDSEDFPGKAIGIAVVMETSSVCGGSEDDWARERNIISVIGLRDL